MSKNFKVIAPEQRGVWRSQAILDGEDISVASTNINKYNNIYFIIKR